MKLSRKWIIDIKKKLFISTGRPLNFVKENDWGFIFDGIIAVSGQLCVVGEELIFEKWPDAKIDTIQRILEHKVYQLSPNDKQESALELLRFMPNCKTSYWHPDYFDIIPADGGKENGIRHILKYFNFTVEESMAFGDSHNDIDMLKYVKIGVAMGNAGDETKAIADYICDTVENDGIVSALKHFELI